VGQKQPCSIVLADGSVLIRGEAEVVAVHQAGEGPEGRAGMRVRFVRMDPASRKVHRELVQHAKLLSQDCTPLLPLMPVNGVHPAKKKQRSSTILGVPIGPLPLEGERRTPGAPDTLPANPLGEMADEALGDFIDCTIHEETSPYHLPEDGVDSAASSSAPVRDESPPPMWVEPSRSQPELERPGSNEPHAPAGDDEHDHPEPRAIATLGVAAAWLMVGLGGGYLLFGRPQRARVAAEPAPAEASGAVASAAPAPPASPTSAVPSALASTVPVPPPPLEELPSPADAPPAPVRTGPRLDLTSTPSGAVFFVNGKRVGKGPLQLPHKKGRVRVVAVKPGFRRWQRLVVVKGEVASVHAKLRRK
jgi:hypothetical protein